MGRAKGGQNATGMVALRGTSAAVIDRAPTFRDSVHALNAVIAGASEDYWTALNDKAARKASGRGGRLLIALNDLAQAEALADTNPQLAQTMTSNALWHAGNIICTFDEKSPIAGRFQAAVRSYGDAQGAEQISYLREHGHLDDFSDEQIDEWVRTAGEGYVAAFATKQTSAFHVKGTKRPEWRALNVLYRAATARDQLAAVDAPEGSDIARTRDHALAEAEKVRRNCRDYLRDPLGEKTSDQVSRLGPEQTTMLQALAHTFTDEQALSLNRYIDQTGVVDRHRALVAPDGKAVTTPVAAISDGRWLDQLMDYSVTITGSSAGGTLAVNSGGKLIMLSPEVAVDAIDAGRRGGFDEIIAHELIHTTQPKPKGSPLADRNHPAAAPYTSRGFIFESQLLEGATQARTNYLRSEHDPAYNGELTVYPTYSAMVAEAQAASGIPAKQFHEELNATPTNQRTAYLARALTGRTDEAAQRDLFEPLLTLNLTADDHAYDIGGYTPELMAWYRQQVRGLYQRLR